MKVLEFAFVAGEDSDYLPHNYDKNCVVYTGTHDNDTLQGWYQTLSEEEKEQAKADMGKMLDYIDKLNELDTSGVEPMSHVFPVNNVFREDVVTNGDGHDDTLANAPCAKDDGFKVPKTIG